MQKKIIYILIGVIIVFCLFGAGLFAYQKTLKPKNLVMSKDLGLSDEVKKIFNQRIEDAQKEIDKLGSKPDEPAKYQYYLIIASNYYGLGEYAKARDVYLNTTKLFPKEPIAWYSLSGVEMQMGDFESADEHVEKALGLDSSGIDSIDYWLRKIDVNVDGLKLSQSEIEKVFKRALEATKNNASIITKFAGYYESLGEKQKAIEQWEKAMGADPQNSDTYRQQIVKLQNK